MSKFFYKNEPDFVHHLKFQFFESFSDYLCIEMDNELFEYKLTLDMLLHILGVTIDENISYCLAETEMYKIKYRKHGIFLDIYVNQFGE